MKYNGFGITGYFLLLKNEKQQYFIMKILLSPAKAIDDQQVISTRKFSVCSFIENADFFGN